jgi:hypothetical protein
LRINPKNEEFHMEISNKEEFQIAAYGFDDSQIRALVKFANAFHLSFEIETLTEPLENRNGLRLPGEGGVVITIKGPQE